MGRIKDVAAGPPPPVQAAAAPAQNLYEIDDEELDHQEDTTINEGGISPPRVVHNDSLSLYKQESDESEEEEEDKDEGPVQFPPPNPQTQPQAGKKPPPRGVKTQQPVEFPPRNPTATAPVQWPPKSGDSMGAPPPVSFPIQSPQPAPMKIPRGYEPQQQVPVNTYAPPQVQPQPQGFAQNSVGNTPVPTTPWKSGIFDCMNDPTNALITLFFPCFTFGQIAEIVDEGRTTCETSAMFYCMLSFVFLPCIMSAPYRTRLRTTYGLIEDGPDFFMHCFCEYCALCQEYRELQSRGLDPSIGWAANKHQTQQVGMNMVPPGKNQMTR